MFFSISGFYYLIFERYHEYIPLIQDYLCHIIKIPERHYWNIHDAAKLLLKLDRDFAEKLFKENGKKLSDFGLN